MRLALAIALSLVAADAASTPDREAIRWLPEHEVAVDLDGDGRQDRLRFGFEDSKLIVAVATAAGRDGRLEFDRGEIACNPVDFGPDCTMPRPVMRVFTIGDEEIRSYAEVFELSADVFISTGKAQIASMPIGETDPIWFFWNASESRLDWLRA